MRKTGAHLALALVILGAATALVVTVSSRNAPAQVPPLPTPTLPLPSGLPTGSASPSPSPTPSESPTETPSPTPESTAFTPAPFPTTAPPPFPTGAPTFAVPAAPAAPAPVVTTVAPGPALSLVGAYGLGSTGPLLAALVLAGGVAFTRPRRRRAARFVSKTVSDQEVAMRNPIRRWRLTAGVSLIIAAAVAAVVGYLKISLEPQIARQVPYLASAGLATLVLAVAGGSLLVADQIRADDERVDEIERSIERLAELVGPSLQAPPRLEESTE